MNLPPFSWALVVPVLIAGACDPAYEPIEDRDRQLCSPPPNQKGVAHSDRRRVEGDAAGR